MSKVTIESNWDAVFKNINIHLFNRYPGLVQRLEEWDEIPYEVQWGKDADDLDEDGEPREYERDVYQWFIVGSTADADWLKEFVPEIAQDIFYSDVLDEYILAVHHYGTGWDCVPLDVVVENDETLAKLYKDLYRSYSRRDGKRQQAKVRKRHHGATSDCLCTHRP